jgi:hypothetical protein
VRIDHLQQVLGKGRELRVDLELYPSGEEGEALQEALDVGVGTLEALQSEASGDLGELAGELPTHLADKAQLAVVVPKQTWIHAPS